MRSYISRTATFAWSPAELPTSVPYIAAGTLSGALDESFSNDSILEIWTPDFTAGESREPIAKVAVSARFNRLVWGYVSSEFPMGVLAAGLETGELALYDAKKLIEGTADPLILRNKQHTGPIKGLHFNPKQAKLLASGGVNGEIYIWDLSNPGKPYSPGARSTKLDEITALSWHSEVPYILATSSSSGYTVVWDLRHKKEVAALTYGGGAGTSAVNGAAANALASGKRRGMGALCWHPTHPTRLATASDDDSAPVVMLWDLRNSLEPEKVFAGHDKGVLALSWCKQDADLLLSCGKDNRTVIWNPSSGQAIGELPASQNWSYDVQWCPKNPNLVATASFDGRISIYPLQSTNQAVVPVDTSAAITDPNDIFNSLPAQNEAHNRGVSLSQPPKWLRKPISATFGFGGKLVTTSNLAGDKGQAQSSVVHLRSVVTEPSIVSRANRLQSAIDSQALADFCDERSKESYARSDDIANWKALLTLFRADSRDELVALLGFSKEDVSQKVAGAISNFRRTSGLGASGLSIPGTPLPSSTANNEKQAFAAEEGAFGAGVENQSSAIEPVEDRNEPNLFGNQEIGDSADFFNNMGNPSVKSAIPDHLHTNPQPSTLVSAAATAGSPGPSSVTSEGLRTNNFRIYPDNESEIDKLITRALVLGDFESAVSLCLSADRHADAILLAVRGGSELLARTQKAYFERKTATSPYLRLFQSVVTDDLTDIVQNADLNEWQEIFVVICTFAKKSEDFVYLAEQLGQRLEYQYTSSGGNPVYSKTYRKNAVLCYLAAGKLEKVANMWADEMREEEVALQNGQLNGAAADSASLFTAHAEALQTFMEKITVFQSAVNYVDVDLTQPSQSEEQAKARTYKLAPLYDRIIEYVGLLADQGLIEPAMKFIAQTPQDYCVDGDNVGSMVRERLFKAEQVKVAGGTSSIGYTAAAPVSNLASAPSNSYAPATSNTAYDAYGASNQGYPSYNTGYDSYSSGYSANVAQQNVRTQAQTPYAPTQPLVPAPPPPILSDPAPAPSAQTASAAAAMPPPPPKKTDSGWNDIPQNLAPKRSTSSMSNRAAAQPITSPFPMSQQQPTSLPPQYGAASPNNIPPPPRGMTPNRGGPMSPPSNIYGRPPPGQPFQAPTRPPPMGPPRGSTPSQQMPPPQQHAPQPPSGPYAPAPGQVSLPPPPAAVSHQGPGSQYGHPVQQPVTSPQAVGTGGGPQPFNRPPMPPMPANGPQNVPMRSVTPGAGAGPPPRSTTPLKPSLKYPPGDRTHIPDSAKPILSILTKELARFKSITPPAQSRMSDNADKRINMLLDLLNCGTLDPKVVQGLHGICQAIEARNQQAALNQHVQLASTSGSGDVGTALVGVKLLISKLNQ